jgi:hypothetical protein
MTAANTRHLTAAELIDALDDALAPSRATHVTACSACQARIDGLRVTLNTTREADVPEPSPLFWDHFSARVAEAIATDPVKPRALDSRHAPGQDTLRVRDGLRGRHSPPGSPPPLC